MEKALEETRPNRVSELDKNDYDEYARKKWYLCLNFGNKLIPSASITLLYRNTLSFVTLLLFTYGSVGLAEC